jgi:hypothetical protein
MIIYPCEKDMIIHVRGFPHILPVEYTYTNKNLHQNTIPSNLHDFSELCKILLKYGYHCRG